MPELTQPQPVDSELEETIMRALHELVLVIGRQVTDAYELKHGIWEGMSIENVQAVDKSIPAFVALIQRREREAKKHGIYEAIGILAIKQLPLTDDQHRILDHILDPLTQPNPTKEKQ